MTNEQAINELKDWQTAFSRMDKNMSYAIEALDMAIEALSELSRQWQRDDLIKRQDALDAIKMLLEQSEDDEHDNTWNNAIRGSINAIKHHVLSAQPDVPDTNVGDLISRKDALKPFCVAPDGIRIPEVDCDNFPVEFSVRFIKKYLRSLPSAQPEKRTEERTETHACDLISRQATVDAINALHEKPNAWLDYAVDAVMALPSAQPEPKTDRDTISRQDAIDAIVKQLGIKDESFLTEQEKTIVKVLRGMQSAQPERKTGEWIRNDNGTYSCSLCQSWIPKEQRHYARYCLYCGADMRGKNNG